MQRKIGIIGGGASGMSAALFAAENNAKVIIYEGNDRLGKKILATGNGKCNLGNLDYSEDKYYSQDSDLMKSYIEKFKVEDTIQFFQKLGLMIIEKKGYLYPLSEQAASVLDVLRFAIERNQNINVLTECKIDKIEKNTKTKQFVVYNGNQKEMFDAIILATGGKAAPKSGSDGSGYELAKHFGHKLIPVVPALVQLKCKEDYFKAIAGVRTEALISVKNNGEKLWSEKGELQLTDYGISGIPVFQLSRNVNYLLKSVKEVDVEIDFLPHIDSHEFEEVIRNRVNVKGDNITLDEYFAGMLNKKIMNLFIKLAGCKNTDLLKDTKNQKIRKIFELCKCFKVTVNGSNSFEQAQVCAGGVKLSELTPNLESKKEPGLFMIGELVDIDGRCGGYNLHWAWGSGAIAGKYAAKGDK